MVASLNSIGFRLLLGLLLSCVIGGLAYWRHALAGSGVLGATLIGTVVFGLGGWTWGGTLVAFFTSSSMLSHYRSAQKANLTENFAKGSRRDLGQTLANGGVALIIAFIAGGTSRPAPLALAFYGALAAANADTWATELGVLAPSRPRLITTGSLVPTGTSGGVTALGLLAALAGATFIGAVAFVLTQGAALLTIGGWLLRDWVLLPATAVSGFLGSLIDSLLGATLQAVYYCPDCAVETERRVHRCGRCTRRIRGLSWLDNDLVNLLASGSGAVIGAVIGALIF